MFHFIKRLEKEVFIAAALVIAIVALTTKGFGGDGRDAMTAMAETPAVSREETAAGEEPGVEYGQQVVGYLLTRDMKRQEQVRRGEGVQTVEDEQGERGAEGLMEGGSGQPGDGLGKAGSSDGDGSEDQAEGSGTREAASGHGGISLTQEDYQILLKIVEAEAGVCDKKGKILVANVVLNRVKSDQFPDTITGVVYQPSQFSPVSNGSINTCRISSDTKESVDRALKGEDYSQGALFFMNRSASRNGAVSWFDRKLTYLFRYQGHEFFK